MQIVTIYKKYRIMPNLQLHMLRAAAVGAYIADHWEKKQVIDKNVILTTLLLHDMGNIIKFDLDSFPKILGDEYQRLTYWKGIQNEFFQRYGYDEHVATYTIAREVGISSKTQEVLENMGSSKLAKVAASDEYNTKICVYADLRVAPFGVVSVNTRFDDLLHRYKGRDHPIANTEQTEKNRSHCLQIEQQMQSYFIGKFTNITDYSIQKYVRLLEDFQIQTQTEPI